MVQNERILHSIERSGRDPREFKEVVLNPQSEEQTQGKTEPRTGGKEQERYVFCKAHAVWKVVFEGKPEFFIKDTFGAKYLDYLLHHPNDPISAFDLEKEIQPEKGKSRASNSIQPGSNAEAIRSYLKEISTLKVELETARDNNDEGKTNQLDSAIEKLEAEVMSNSQQTDTGERARNNVRKAIQAVRRNLAKGNAREKTFGRHISRFVKVGYECSYIHPNEEGIWR